MREIFFRGKTFKCPRFVFGDLLHDRTFDRVCIVDNDMEYPINPATVGQYTGLTDKNGKKIFEGDIVEFKSHGYIPCIERGTVIYKDGCYGIEYISEIGKHLGWDKQFHRIGLVSEWQDMGASGTITYTYKVIGNIHDNPELLKGGEG